MKLNGRRRVGVLLLAALALGLAVFAATALRRSRHLSGSETGAVEVRRIALTEAPWAVQEAAGQLGASQVGYAMPVGPVTYLIISTGESGERIDVVGAARDPEFKSWVNVDLRSNQSGERLLVLLMRAAITDQHSVRFWLDGHAGRIPALINPDHLPLVRLPDAGAMVLVSPASGARVTGAGLQITGYCRLQDGEFNVQVFAGGKGRLLGQALGLRAAGGAPDWGSFKVSVPVAVPPDVTDGVVLIYDLRSGAKSAVRVRFSSK